MTEREKPCDCWAMPKAPEGTQVFLSGKDMDRVVVCVGGNSGCTPLTPDDAYELGRLLITEANRAWREGCRAKQRGEDFHI